jgi:PEP-CTERM motif
MKPTFQLQQWSALIATSMVAVSAMAGVNPDVVTATIGKPVYVKDPGGSGREAELTILSGSGVLSFSNGGILDTGLLPSGAKPAAVGGLVGALNTGKVVLTSVDGAAITEKNVTLSSTRAARGIVSIGAAVTSLSVNGNTGAIGLVSATGGATQTAPYIEGTLDGGQMTVNNLKIDLTNKLVYADMTYKALQLDGTYGPVVSNPGVALWNIGSISGPTLLAPMAVIKAADGDFSELLALGYQQVSVTPRLDGSPAIWSNQYVAKASNVLSNLTVTREGFDIFAAGLGLAPGSIGYDALDGVNSKAGGWGSMTSELIFQTTELASIPPGSSLPEPSTYALMGLGLVGVALAARQRRLHTA